MADSEPGAWRSAITSNALGCHHQPQLPPGDWTIKSERCIRSGLSRLFAGRFKSSVIYKAIFHGKKNPACGPYSKGDQDLSFAKKRTKD